MDKQNVFFFFNELLLVQSDLEISKKLVEFFCSICSLLMKVHFLAEEGEAFRQIASFGHGFLLLPKPLQERLSKEANKLVRCIHLNQSSEWEWSPGLFGDMKCYSWETLKERAHQLEGGLIEEVWTYTLTTFGTSVAQHVGFKLKWDGVEQECRLQYAPDFLAWLCSTNMDKDLCELEWWEDKLRCYGSSSKNRRIELESPTWASFAFFYRQLHEAGALHKESTVLIKDLREIVIGYLVHFEFFKVFKDLTH
jgi:hypothetical protein